MLGKNDMMHVIVTGGAGFIGSHLCEALLEKGYAVTAVDNFCTGRKSNLVNIFDHESFELVEADLCEPMKWDQCKFLSTHGLFGLFHFACPASPVDFDKIPFEILGVDSVGTIQTVDLAMKYQARYLLASTSEIYGDPEVHPQKEEYFGNVNSIGPRACYDEAKRFAEAYVSSAARGVGTYRGKPFRPLNAGMVRIFNTYGPRMRADDGRVVPQMCVQALKDEKLTIHGDGMQTRSFCYVSDLVEGIIRLFESDVKVPVNIGNPVERTILDFAQNVSALVGRPNEIEHLPSRVDDPRQRCPDISRAKQLLKWSPQVDLKDGLSQTLEYFRRTISS